MEAQGAATNDVAKTIDPSLAVKVDEVLNGDVLDYITKTVQRTVVGEHNAYGIRMVVLASCQRALTNGKGIYIFVNGALEGGKSWLIRQVLWCFPPEWVIDGGVTPQALFYMNATEPKVFYIDDFNGLNEDIKTTLKQVLMNFRRPTKRFVSNYKMQTCDEQTVAARTVVMFSAVDSIPDKQMMSRLFQIPPAGGDNSKSRIYDYDVATADGSIEDLDAVVDERVQVCHEVLRILLAKQVTVIIPFLKEVQWRDEKRSRDYNVLFDLIKLSAILEQRRRDVDSRGRIIATYEDFYKARDIFEPRRQMMSTKLSEGPQKALNWLVSRSPSGFTQAEIVAGTGISQGNLSRYLETLKEMSLVVEDTDIRTRGMKEVTMKVYKYLGDKPKTSLYDTPIDLCEREKAKPEYKKWREEHDTKIGSV